MDLADTCYPLEGCKVRMEKKCQHFQETFVLEPKKRELERNCESSVLYRNNEDPAEGLGNPTGSALEEGNDGELSLKACHSARQHRAPGIGFQFVLIEVENDSCHDFNFQKFVETSGLPYNLLEPVQF